MSKTAIVIGAGVGGLAAAIHLARAGLRVRVLERGDSVGGKLREVMLGGRSIPAGPSVFTMRYVFEELFGGPEALAQHLTLEPIDPLCRHFFSDGSQLDLYHDAERTRAAIEAFAGPRDARGYMDFRRHAHKIHEIVRGPFMERPLAVFDLLRPSTLLQIASIDGTRTLWKAISPGRSPGRSAPKTRASVMGIRRSGPSSGWIHTSAAMIDCQSRSDGGQLGPR